MAAVGEVDTAIGQLVHGLADMGQPANLVVVADHGMAEISQDRTIPIHRIANPADYRVVEATTYVSLAPCPAARPRSRQRCSSRTTISPAGARPISRSLPLWPQPASPYFCLADTGWLVVKTASAKVRRPWQSWL